MVFVIFLFAAVVFMQVPAQASGGIDPADPMVKMTSPPCSLNITKVLASVSKDVSKATGIKESFITYYWQTFDHVVYEGKENHYHACLHIDGQGTTELAIATDDSNPVN